MPQQFGVPTAIRLTPHQFEIYQKLRRDRMIPVWRLGEIMGTTDRSAVGFAIGMKIPIYALKRGRGARISYHVFSSDVVLAVENAHRLPTIQLSRSLISEVDNREFKKRRALRGFKSGK